MSKKPMTFEEQQAQLIKNLMENHKYEKATNVIVFDESKLPLPKGVTPESTQLHVDWFNQLTGATEEATAQITRDLHKENDELFNVDGTLSFHGINFNTSHHLKQTIGDADIYGNSTSIMDFQFSDDCSNWIAEMRTNNESLASKLFDK